MLSGCELETRYEYEFEALTDNGTNAILQDELQPDVWSLARDEYSIHISQRSDAQQFRLFIAVESNDQALRRSNRSDDRFYYFDLSTDLTCPATVEFFDQPQQSLMNFLHPGLDDRYTYADAVTRPAQSAIVSVTPCGKEDGLLVIGVISSNGDVLLEDEIRPRLVKAGTYWRTVF